MHWLISFVAPRRWWDWPIGIAFWGLMATFVTHLAKLMVAPQMIIPFVDQYLFSSLGAAPFVVVILALTRKLNIVRQELTTLAATDPLRSFANRRDFLLQVEGAGPGVLMMLDLDHFKMINDTHGHGVGDQILLQTADMIRGVVRKSDLVGRLGGEEFSVFLSGATIKEAARIGDRLAQGIEFTDGGTAFSVTASVGAVEVTSEHTDLPTLMRVADKALYAAKKDGRAQFTLARQAIDVNGTQATVIH